MRGRLLILSPAVAMLGWGMVLPYQYAYAAQTRGWGGLVAALASTLFSVGALLAAPVGGRLADRGHPVRVAVAARVIAAVGVGSLALADAPALFLLGMTAFGVGITAANPAQTLLVLRLVPVGDRRRVLAWQFSGQALGMALGALLAGAVVDLHDPDGLDPAFLGGALGFLAAAALVGLARPGREETTAVPAPPASTSRLEALRAVRRTPALRWAGVVTVALALGFYAQFESGLPAYALTVLRVEPSTIGLASAANCLVIVALQVVVVRLTARRHPATLLLGVGAIWVLSWLVLGAASLVPAAGAWLFVGAFAAFGVGETMWAPVLAPLAAELAPRGHAGTVIGLFQSVQTGVSAAGPLVAGALLGAGLTSGYLALHLGISVVAVLAGLRLRRAMRVVPGVAPAAARSAHVALPV